MLRYLKDNNIRTVKGGDRQASAGYLLKIATLETLDFIRTFNVEETIKTP
jgi:hypothetical protein